uniref:Uncharacterized protein n=1 Tax=Arundo donax TaxID=35708 RepID=A0A0A9A6W3_ARUDO
MLVTFGSAMKFLYSIQM